MRWVGLYVTCESTVTPWALALSTMGNIMCRILQIHWVLCKTFLGSHRQWWWAGKFSQYSSYFSGKFLKISDNNFQENNVQYSCNNEMSRPMCYVWVNSDSLGFSTIYAGHHVIICRLLKIGLRWMLHKTLLSSHRLSAPTIWNAFHVFFFYLFKTPRCMK